MLIVITEAVKTFANDDTLEIGEQLATINFASRLWETFPAGRPTGGKQNTNRPLQKSCKQVYISSVELFTCMSICIQECLKTSKLAFLVLLIRAAWTKLSSTQTTMLWQKSRPLLFDRCRII